MARASLRNLAGTALIGLLISPATLLAQGAGNAPPQAEVEAAEQRRRAATTRQDEAQRAVAEARRNAAEAKRKANLAQRNAEQLRRDEADMLARARAEAEERVAARRMREAEAERTEAERAAVAARNEAEALQRQLSPAEKEAAEERLIEAARAADAARRSMEEARETEISRLTERMRQAQQRRAARERSQAPEGSLGGAQLAAPEQAPLQTQPDIAPRVSEPSLPAADRLEHLKSGSAPQPVAPSAPSAPFLGEPAVAAPISPSTRVTVLILMQPGDRGIRRLSKTADPVLCLGDVCYISRGPDQDARRVRRGQALGALNTLGGRAGACREQLGCVFRNVDLGGARARLEPIDLRLMRHDRREVQDIGADMSCDLVGGRLQCAAGITAVDYRLWLVPEFVATKAGPAVLDAAVRAGLSEGRRAGLVR